MSFLHLFPERCHPGPPASPDKGKREDLAQVYTFVYLTRNWFSNQSGRLLPDALSGKPPAVLEATLLHGRAGTAMPPWAPFMSEQEAAWLVERLLTGDAP